MNDFKDSLYKLIGNQIKSRREELRMNQADLSAKLNISRSSISNIEVGRHQVPLFTLYEIAKELKMDVKNLIPSLEEVTVFATKDFKDYSTYLSTTDLDSDKINKYISNI